MKSLEDLLNTNEPAWPTVQEWIAQAQLRVQVLPASEPRRSQALVASQVTVRSPMGAIIHETGGILLDNGWIRLLGSGHPRLPLSLPEVNAELVGWKAEDGASPPFLVVATDVVGGIFAIDGGGLELGRGKVCYLSPDTMKWESLDLNYSEWLQWMLAGTVSRWYKDYRWRGWQSEVRALPGDSAFSIQPFPFAAGEPLAQRDRRAIPLLSLCGMYLQMSGQVQDLQQGDKLVVLPVAPVSDGGQEADPPPSVSVWPSPDRARHVALLTLLLLSMLLSILGIAGLGSAPSEDMPYRDSDAPPPGIFLFQGLLMAASIVPLAARLEGAAVIATALVLARTALLLLLAPGYLCSGAIWMEAAIAGSALLARDDCRRSWDRAAIPAWTRAGLADLIARDRHAPHRVAAGLALATLGMAFLYVLFAPGSDPIGRNPLTNLGARDWGVAGLLVLVMLAGGQLCATGLSIWSERSRADEART